MTDEQINQRIAEACGWKEVEPWLNGDRCFEKSNTPCGYRIEDLPDYCNDLNAMHEAEKTMDEEQWHDYVEYVGGRWEQAMHATARQRAEAFLRALGKWEEVQG